ncbi:inorganic phosphate transporter [Haloferax mediterranei ATCC 33500]|uniref:Phosphate transporter n=1 Tax=Haloferax mediterranei (strain ATCC 33500 / DSM 1411 / JCM 8866 / NBRC 14739 / NCIMB 2177 / R-4) TaxID=523841 RepID=I3R185_HALMT|nr:inorganic phosphate transporter [Haloferax mediterranei]AFK17995.1 phosphate/sulfate permease [Haloferax mediterranei ATCC 33500]AHZ22586.1 phosphate transporter [Haloferax mediterranei ATCC 33500]EMA02729.1 phosphate/sulfate permease [Haloferax mediterranei ATCC 33500]MDX5988087.1 inorganic phosphate transporter [Haloferax mediterranei ATCC 33500]QCQ74540.1 inorganic phosphate transporter [Haloferax mediterranei ATCC 33500]
MVAVGTLATFVVAALASLFMAWAIGAGSSGSTPFAPAVGANAISVMRAGFIVGLLGFAGAFLQGANVTNAVGTELIGGVTLTAAAAVVALLTAAVLVALGVFAGYPIATAFTVTGAVVGVGLAMGGVPAWSKYQQILSLWVLTPFVGGGASYATARTLRAEEVSERWTVPALAGIVGLLVANMEFASLGVNGSSASVARVAALELTGVVGIGETVWFVVASLSVGLVAAAIVGRWISTNQARGQRRFLLALGGLVAFSAGGSQVGLAIGPLVPLLDAVTVPLPALLVGGGLGLLAGSWTGAPRMIKALAQDYSSLGPRRSIAAMIPSFAIAQTAVALGVPVSFNEIIVSAIIGSGYAAGGSGVSGRKMLYTVLAWIGSLLLAFGLGYGIFTLVSIVFPV